MRNRGFGLRKCAAHVADSSSLPSDPIECVNLFCTFSFKNPSSRDLFLDLGAMILKFRSFKTYQLMRENPTYLDLSNGIVIQQTVFISNSKTKRFRNRLEVSWDGHKRWMASIGRIDLSMCSKNGVSSSPAESNCTDLSCARYCSNSVDKGIDERLCR